MKTEFIALFVVVGSIGLAGFVLMMASFMSVHRNGGWTVAMQQTVNGRWPRVRWTMLAGALLLAVFLVIATAMAVLEMMSGGWRS